MGAMVGGSVSADMQQMLSAPAQSSGPDKRAAASTGPSSGREADPMAWTPAEKAGGSSDVGGGGADGAASHEGGRGEVEAEVRVDALRTGALWHVARWCSRVA